MTMPVWKRSLELYLQIMPMFHKRSFTIKCGEYDYYSGGETLDEINQKYDLNLDYGDSITAECEVFTYEIFPAEITILSVITD